MFMRLRTFGYCIPALIVSLSSSPSAAADAPAGPQWRAFWVDAFNVGIKTPQQVDKLVADLKSLHCNAVVVQVRKRGDALYRDSLEPFTEDPAIPAGFDPLGDLLAKAHAAGLQVHAWCNVSTIWRNEPPPHSPRHVFNTHGLNAAGRDYWLTCDETGNALFETGYS